MGRKLGLERVLDCFSLSVCANACVCVHAGEDEDEENDSCLPSGAKGKQELTNARSISLSKTPLHNMLWTLLIFTMDADGGAEGVYALLRMRQESSEAHLQDGRYHANEN